MNWIISKEYRFRDNEVMVTLCPSTPLPADTSIVGYQGFTEEQWNKLWRLAGKPEPLIKASYGFGDVSSSFVVTTCQLEIAGVAFLVGKGKNRNWATSTFAGDVNPNFTTMSVSEMLIHFGLV
jgi:hypothetical protein